MRKLPAVEEARAVMTEGMEWGTWKWLLEKTRVQEIADRATAALDQADLKVRASWSDDLKAAYKQLCDDENRSNREKHGHAPGARNAAPALKTEAEKVKEAYERGQRARRKAEETFERAEQRMSAEMAREGARQALESYDLREKAIRMAEAVER